MKQLLFLLLLPCLVMAQYQGNENQKITLGEQTTADGLVWRGRLADTANLLTNKLDTSVYIVLDTGTRAMWYYSASTTPKWTRLVDSLNNLQGTLSVAKGGTGSAMQNFVDLTTGQSVNGVKNFLDTIIVNKGIRFPATQLASTNVNTLDDYEEGTWTTTFGTKVNLTGTPVLSSAFYRKIGQIVYLEGKITGLSITSTNTRTVIQFSTSISMNANITSQVGNVYTYIGSTEMSGIISDWSTSDKTNLGIYIPNSLVTNTGTLDNILFSITYISEN